MAVNRLLKNNLLYLTSSGIGGILGYLFHFTVGRKLSISQYGEFQAITAIMLISGVFFSTVSYFTIKYSAVLASYNDYSRQAEFLAYIKKKFRLLIIFVLVIFFLLLPLIKSFLHFENYSGLLIIGLSTFVIFYSSIYGNALQGWSDFWALSIIGVMVAMVKLISGYLLVIYFPSSSSATVSILISAVFGWLMLRYYFQKYWPLAKKQIRTNLWREKYFAGVNFKKSLMSITFFSVGLALISNADIILVKNITSAEIAGYYAALSVLGKVILWINMSIIAVLFPDACSDGYSGKPASKKSLLLSYELIGIASLFLVAIYYYFPSFIVGMLYGEKYLPVAQYLWTFSLMAVALSLLTLEAKMALARQGYRSTWILMLTFMILSLGIVYSKNEIYSIVSAVTFALFFGWIMLFIFNLAYRWKYKKAC